MILLTDITDELRVELNQPVAIQIHASYVDLNLQTRQQTPGRTGKIIDTVGVHTFLSSSNTYGTPRAVKQLSFHNSDPVESCEISIIHASKAPNESIYTLITLYQSVLPREQSVQYTTGQGFYNQGQFDQGTTTDILTTDGLASPGYFVQHIDNYSTEGITTADLKTQLGVDEIVDIFSIDGGNITLDLPPGGSLDLNGGSLINTLIDCGTLP